jgi:hypothetical protein
MQRGVRRSHEMSQKKLKGSPKTMGYTRSQSGTEKQTATKGIHPRRIDPTDGRFKTLSFRLTDGIVTGLCTCVNCPGVKMGEIAASHSTDDKVNEFSHTEADIDILPTLNRCEAASMR